MYLPALSNMEQRRQQQIITFGGINYGQNTQDGQLADCRNLTAEHFPCLHPRAGRKAAVSGLTAPEQIFAAEGNLYIVDNGALKLGDSTLLTLTPGKKQMAVINSKLVIFPDKVMVDTTDMTVTRLEAMAEIAAGMMEVVAGADGSTTGQTVKIHIGNYQATVVGSGNLGGNNMDDLSQWNETARPFGAVSSVSVSQETGAVTIETSTGKTCRDIAVGDLVYAPALGINGVTRWAKITKRYYRFKPANPVGPSSKSASTQSSNSEYYIGWDYDIYGVVGSSVPFAGMEDLGFRAGDTVEIAGCTTHPENNKSITIRALGTVTEGDATVYTITFDPDTLTAGIEAGAVTIRRKVPALSILCESQNRLWGAAGSTVYASALGDPCNWETFDGLSTDAYAVAVAGGGQFTACCGYGSGVLFFKEDMVYKILGGYPAEYTLYSYHYPGVQLGSAESLININEVLYYKGAAGVWRYAGAAPELVSGAFGLRQYTNAWAGRCGQRYYLSMKGKDGGYGVWVYDTLRGFWLQEDERNAGFAWSNGRFYLLDRGAKKVYLTGQDNSEETRVPWSAELCAMDEVVHNRKSYSRLLLRADFEAGSWLKAEISMDGGPWQTAGQWSAGHGQTRVIPLLPRRCDRFRIRLSGEGNVMLRSLTRDYTLGSEY